MCFILCSRVAVYHVKKNCSLISALTLFLGMVVAQQQIKIIEQIIREQSRKRSRKQRKTGKKLMQELPTPLHIDNEDVFKINSSVNGKDLTTIDTSIEILDIDKRKFDFAGWNCK